MRDFLVYEFGRHIKYGPVTHRLSHHDLSVSSEAHLTQHESAAVIRVRPLPGHELDVPEAISVSLVVAIVVAENLAGVRRSPPAEIVIYGGCLISLDC